MFSLSWHTTSAPYHKVEVPGVDTCPISMIHNISLIWVYIVFGIGLPKKSLWSLAF